MRVRYTRRAIKNLDAIRAYISEDNPDAAWIVASFIRREIGVLEDFPYRGIPMTPPVYIVPKQLSVVTRVWAQRRVPVA